MLYNQALGCSVLLVALFGLAHNFFLSAGGMLGAPLPSTHPLTAAGLVILAIAMFFRAQWHQAAWLRVPLCLAMILISGLRVAEALFPSHISFFAAGSMTTFLESAGLHGRFSVETAVFLAACFCFELTHERQGTLRLLLVSICLAVLSLGFTETVYAFFLWGNELSVITQFAMWLVSVDLLVRIRNQQPLRSFFSPGKPNFYLQFTALALYLLPMILGAVLLNKLHITAEKSAPFELVFAATSCVLLAIVVTLGTYLDRDSAGESASSMIGSNGKSPADTRRSDPARRKTRKV
ncbi:hypothetical protein [Roseibium sp. Sym1]|uniref:hypothetical protein n=1 Tax=Roseibium sp. Sym1 TaxID=3016006 RepID=UPI0022B39545|nr:hypothetical protein [Roseibium sp. Sym1]